MIKNRLNRSVCLGSVGRTNHGHTGNGAHKSQVLAALVGCAVLANGDAGVSADNVNVKSGIADRVSDLLVGSACGKHRKRGCKHLHARCSNTCRNADHVALCNSAVEESLGKFLLKHTRLGCSRKVCVKNEEFIFIAKLGKRRAITFSGCLLICHFRRRPYLRDSAIFSRSATATL